MSANLITDIPQQYDTVHDIISWIDSFRIYAIRQKRRLSLILTGVLLLTLGVLALFLLFIVVRITFKILLWFFVPRIRFDNVNIELSKDKYVQLRNQYDTIDKDIQILQKVGNDFQQNIKYPFFLNGLMSDLGKIITAIITAHQQLGNILQSMNFPNNINTAPFQAASEEELWKNRNKAYQYLM